MGLPQTELLQVKLAPMTIEMKQLQAENQALHAKLAALEQRQQTEIAELKTALAQMRELLQPGLAQVERE